VTLMGLTLDVSKLDLRLLDKKIGKENLEELRFLLSYLSSKDLDISKLVLGGGLAVSILLNFENLRYQLSKTDIDLIYPESEKLERILAHYPRRIETTAILDEGVQILGSLAHIHRESFLEDTRVLKIHNANVELDIIERWLLATRYVRVPLNEETLERYTKPLVLRFSEDESYQLRIIDEKLALFTQFLLLSGEAAQDAVRMFRALELLKRYPALTEPATIQEFFEFCKRYSTSRDELIKQYKLIYATLSRHKWRARFMKEIPEWYSLFVEQLAREIVHES